MSVSDYAGNNGRGAYSNFSGPGGGSNYTFRSTPTGQGNWNTGGQITGTGSFQNGITKATAAAYGPGNPRGRQGQPVAPVMAPPVPQVPIPQPNPFSWLRGFTGENPQFSVSPYPPGPSYGRGAPLGLPPGQNFQPFSSPQPAGYPGATVYKNQNFPPATGVGGLSGNPGRRPSH